MWLNTVCTTAFGALIIILIIHKFKRRRIVSLQGKVIVITGASSGLGRACARAFYCAGAKVILCSRRLEELKKVAESIVLRKPDVAYELYPPKAVTLDLKDLESIPLKAKELLSQFNDVVDVLINNAGISYRGSICTTTLAVDQQVMLVNYLGQVALSKALLPYMIARKSGHIVGISSLQGLISIPYRSAYSASKHALQAFYDCLRAEVDTDNVKVTVVSPSYIKTQLSVNALTGQGKLYGVVDDTTASGMDPIDVAKCIVAAVEQEASDVIIAPVLYRLVIILRTFLPSVYFKVMAWRAKKQALVKE